MVSVVAACNRKQEVALTVLQGKGIQKTWWLVGKEGFDLELPEPPPIQG